MLKLNRIQTTSHADSHQLTNSPTSQGNILRLGNRWQDSLGPLINTFVNGMNNPQKSSLLLIMWRDNDFVTMIIVGDRGRVDERGGRENGESGSNGEG